MELNKALEILKIEQECVRRQDTELCNRDECGCQCCDLIQESADVLEAYDIAITCVAFTIKYTDGIVECMSKCGCETIEDFQKFLKGVEGI